MKYEDEGLCVNSALSATRRFSWAVPTDQEN